MKRVGPKVRRTRTKTRAPDPFFAEDEQQAQAEHYEALLDTALADVGLDTRSVNILETAGIILVRDLAKRTREELLQIRNLGEDSLQACQKVLDQIRVEHPDWRRPKLVKGKKREVSGGSG